jgi:hypothetical protein
MRRWPGRALLVWLALAGLGGCGTAFVYDRLDTLAGLYFKGLVSLDDDQEMLLSRTLKRNLQWHREAELRRYDEFLQELAAQIRSGLTRESVVAAAKQAEDSWRRIFEQAVPGYTALARTLTDQQVDELLANLADEDEEAWDDYAERTPEARRSRSTRSLQKNVQRLVGPLLPPQRELLAAYVDHASPLMPEWRENRRIWRDALRETLARRNDLGPEFDRSMRTLIAESEALWTAPYRRAVERRRADFIEMLLQLDATLTAQQRDTASKRLTSLAKELRSLAPKGP